MSLPPPNCPAYILWINIADIFTQLGGIKGIQREKELENKVQDSGRSPGTCRKSRKYVQKSSSFRWATWDVPESYADVAKDVRCLK